MSLSTSVQFHIAERIARRAYEATDPAPAVPWTGLRWAERRAMIRRVDTVAIVTKTATEGAA